MQADVRKKVLWCQWAECAMAGARNRRGRETLRTNGGDDEREMRTCEVVSCGVLLSWGVGRLCTRGHNASQRVTAP